MNKNFELSDLGAMASSLIESVKGNGGFSPSQVLQSVRVSEPDLRAGILLALRDGSLNGSQVLSALKAQFDSSAKVSASAVYPLLEYLVDESLLTVKVKSEIKKYALTDAGKLAADEAKLPKAKSGQDSNPSWTNSLLPHWIDLKGEIAQASKQLGSTLLQVSQVGDREQQVAAADVLLEATRKLHEILGREKPSA